MFGSLVGNMKYAIKIDLAVLFTLSWNIRVM
jgi:hypothetical protein